MFPTLVSGLLMFPYLSLWTGALCSAYREKDDAL